MTSVIVAGLSLGLLAAASSAAAEHRVQIDHRSGAVDAHYRGNVDVSHKQIGSAAPGGRASSLRCAWTAKISVNREARHASGAVMTRAFESDTIVKGSRPGWCSTNTAAIAQDVALRTDDIQRHLLAAAEKDHAVLTAEVERLGAAVPAG
ncbi:MAG: hypothetical protein V4533_14015 [Pseudomonadota bacterium]|jgi:hypothetical protein|tara:strand:- start:344 stop:793 length:450 start_codon:yes stop_codon:yes gene_type:complete